MKLIEIEIMKIVGSIIMVEMVVVVIVRIIMRGSDVLVARHEKIFWSSLLLISYLTSFAT